MIYPGLPTSVTPRQGTQPKPALDWVVERQCVKTDKDSGIVNDANEAQ